MPFVIDNISTESLSVNGADMCKIEAPVYDIYPFPILQTFTKTCTEVKDTSGQGLNYNGWKLTGTIQLDSNSSYGEYLGTIRIKNANTLPFPPYVVLQNFWKTTGAITYLPSVSGVAVNEPLSVINRVWDNTNEYTVYMESEFVQFSDVDGDDLLFDVVYFATPSDLETDPVDNMTFNISYELEILILKDVEASFNFEPFIP